MSLKVRSVLVLVVGTVLGLTISLGGGVLAERQVVRAPDSLPLDEARLLAEVLERVRRDYVEVVDDRQLIESAIRGMIADLDPHSQFLDSREYEEIRISTTGNYSGVGLDVSLDDGRVVDLDLAAIERDLQGLTIHGRRLAGLDVGRHHLARNDIVGEDRDQLVTIFRLQKRLHGAGGQGREGFVGRGENREGTIALQGFDEARRLHRGHEGGKGVTAGGQRDHIPGRLRLGGVVVFRRGAASATSTAMSRKAEGQRRCTEKKEDLNKYFHGHMV